MNCIFFWLYMMYFQFLQKVCLPNESAYEQINVSIFSKVDIEPINNIGVLSNYQKNGEFHLENYTAIKHSVTYSCCPDAPFPDLTYYVVLRRRPLFYVFNLILPCVLINGIGKDLLASSWISLGSWTAHSYAQNCVAHNNFSVLCNVVLICTQYNSKDLLLNSCVH